MGWEIWSAGLTMLAILGILILRDYLGTRGPVLTGQGTLVGRTVQASRISTGLQGRDRRLYRLTFRLPDGEELILCASEHAYLTLEDNIKGQLTWRKDTLIEFMPD